jgi:hypothetical protein
MAYAYQPRSASAWEKRANQQSGEFEAFIKDEYQTYKPKKGDNVIRVLPPTWPDAEHYGIDVYVHYGVGPSRASVVCPSQMKRERCPVCEARNRALKLGNEEEAQELKPTKRVIVWLIDRLDEDRGPLLWAMPFRLDRDFAKLARDKQSGEIYAIDHPDKGFDLSFDRTGEGIKVQYGGLSLARRPSAVAESHLAFIDKRPVPETLLWRDYAEIKRLYEGGPSQEDEEPVRRRVQPDRDEPAPRQREVTRRRLEGSEEPADLREQYNQEVPFEGGKPVNGEDETVNVPPQSAAQRLRERYQR